MYQMIQFLFIIMGLINHGMNGVFILQQDILETISPWENEPWDKCPTKYRQMRLYAQYFIKKGDFMKAIYRIMQLIIKKYKKQ